MGLALQCGTSQAIGLTEERCRSKGQKKKEKKKEAKNSAQASRDSACSPTEDEGNTPMQLE